MRKNGYNVDLFDTNLLDNPFAIAPVLSTLKPKYLVIYDDGFNYLTKMCLTNMREACFSMIGLGKKNGCIVIVCSSDATDHYEKYLQKGADYIIQGEGEMTLLELINMLDSNGDTDDISEIVSYENAVAKVHAKRIVLNNLDELPMPAWDLADIKRYRKIWQQSGQEFTLNIATTRGCPYKCNWCAKPIYGNRYNSHSPEYIAKHLEFLSKKYGVNRFWMCDDIFGLKPNWVKDFSVALAEKELKIRYYIQSRVDLLLKEDTIEALANSGLEEVWVGAESASQKILDAMDKGTKVSQIYEATKLLKEKNIRVALFLQFGYPGENPDDIAETIAMVKELQPDNIGVSVAYPLPGTKFYENVKNDLKLKANWKDSDDLEMMFNGSFQSPFYKKLQRFVHKEYRKSQGVFFLKEMFRHPEQMSVRKAKSILKLSYYIPALIWMGRFEKITRCALILMRRQPITTALLPIP
ncbi:B12-binding domain-containing radical SAM protein [Flavobacterium sp. 3HN19-14]|uniref:B12-binding domain-containing radical SAM protein n=1 Tax=Flavobacterium sp. 3HN19-14 TaxID=3448133 RepID=UPI003EE11D7C